MEFSTLEIKGFGTAEFYYDDFQYWINKSFDEQVEALTQIRESVERINLYWSRVEWCAILADATRPVTNCYERPND